MAIIEKIGGDYIVKPNDTLSRIASSQGRTLQELLASNPQYSANPNLIRPGEVIRSGSSSGPSYANAFSSPAPAQPTSPYLPEVSSEPAPNPTTSFTKSLIGILKDAQGITQSGQAKLMKQGQDIKGQGLKDAAGVFNNKYLAPSSGTSLGLSAQDARAPLSLSVENQQKLASQNLGNITDLVDRTQNSYDKEQDRIASIAEAAADRAYKEAVLAETIRSNKANESISRQKASAETSGGLFGSAKLTTGQKNDVADMLVLRKQIDALKGLKDRFGGYVGVAGGGLGSLQSAYQKVTGMGFEGGQDTRNAIGQIKGFIAKLRGGTSFTPNEQRLLDTYTPGINDSDPVIDSKLNSLQNYIRDKIESTVLVAGGNYIPETPLTSSGILKSPDGSLEVNTSELTPNELREAREAGWR